MQSKNRTKSKDLVLQELSKIDKFLIKVTKRQKGKIQLIKL